MLSVISVTGIPARFSSWAVSLEPCRSGRVSSAKTWNLFPCSHAALMMPRAVPKSTVANAPALHAHWEMPYALVKSDYVATVDPELCAGCGTCEDRCQFGALKVVDDVSRVDATRCIGCGVCSFTCPQSALTLTMRDRAKRKVPPETLMDWMIEKAKSRGVNQSDLL